jgi:dynein heavy chain
MYITPYMVVLDNMPSLLNGLRMVWVISRHYNTDERMAPLLYKIAETIYRRVKEDIKLSEMLELDYNSAREKIELAKKVLELWRDTYRSTRAKMEKSESSRWNFEQTELFGNTNYSINICGDLLKIIEALDNFRKFLGPELIAVTGDTVGINQVLLRVEGLTTPLRMPQEDKIFEPSYKEAWTQSMKRFTNEVEEIEKLTELFIQESFKKLRSAEGAFDLVQNFQKISAGGTGGVLSKQINSRYKDILDQYGHELDAISQLFVTQKDRPPLYRNHPPVAGAIAWARDLYHRAKRPIVRFRKHGGLLQVENWEGVKERYLIFARAVDVYINELHGDWEMSVAATVTEKLRLPILRSIASYSLPSRNDKGVVDFILPPPPYRVSFSHELKMVIRESRYLDKLGFTIPDQALNLTLQV